MLCPQDLILVVLLGNWISLTFNSLLSVWQSDSMEDQPVTSESQITARSQLDLFSSGPLRVKNPSVQIFHWSWKLLV